MSATELTIGTPVDALVALLRPAPPSWGGRVRPICPLTLFATLLVIPLVIPGVGISGATRPYPGVRSVSTVGSYPVGLKVESLREV